MKLFLGVDGGQSGTTAVIGDETGRVLGTGEAGPCNHMAAGEGRAKLERAVNGSVAAACAQAGIDPATIRFEAACFGMSAALRPYPRRVKAALCFNARFRRVISWTVRSSICSCEYPVI